MPELGSRKKPARRQDPRFDVSLTVDCPSRPDINHVTNISRGGFFVEGSSMPVDSELELDLHLNADGPVHARARVVWNYEHRGSGLRFVSVPGDDLVRLQAFLGMLEADSHLRGLPRSVG